jgi:hypothetical protein
MFMLTIFIILFYILFFIAVWKKIKKYFLTRIDIGEKDD